MRLPLLIFICSYFPIVGFAQTGIITGTVTHGDNKTPLPRASVFLSNSSVGSATNEDGKYTLSGIRPGQYILVVTILGYENYTKTLLVGQEPIRLDIQMTAREMMLREVVITSSADWKKNYEAFRKEFIGVDENAKSCSVMNPHILNLTYNPTKQLLHADADEFLVVENKALGYRVKFLLNDFKIDKISNIISREGQQVFEELPGSEAQKKRWHEKREEAYYGSSMHFYRSLYTDKLTQDGFEMYKYNRYFNPERPAEEVIRQKIRIFTQMRRNDSLRYWIDLANMSKYYHESLAQPKLSQCEVLASGGRPGVFAIHFSKYLYVVYKRKKDDVYNKDIYRPLDMSNYAVSIITLNGPYTLFDMNGVIVDDAPLYEGAWARDRLSDMLPYDYVPDQK